MRRKIILKDNDDSKDIIFNHCKFSTKPNRINIFNVEVGDASTADVIQLLKRLSDSLKLYNIPNCIFVPVRKGKGSLKIKSKIRKLKYDNRNINLFDKLL